MNNTEGLTNRHIGSWEENVELVTRPSRQCNHGMHSLRIFLIRQIRKGGFIGIDHHLASTFGKILRLYGVATTVLALEQESQCNKNKDFQNVADKHATNAKSVGRGILLTIEEWAGDIPGA